MERWEQHAQLEEVWEATPPKRRREAQQRSKTRREEIIHRQKNEKREKRSIHTQKEGGPASHSSASPWQGHVTTTKKQLQPRRRGLW